jgi:hypothetical protein
MRGPPITSYLYSLPDIFMGDSSSRARSSKKGIGGVFPGRNGAWKFNTCRLTRQQA